MAMISVKVSQAVMMGSVHHGIAPLPPISQPFGLSLVPSVPMPRQLWTAILSLILTAISGLSNEREPEGKPSIRAQRIDEALIVDGKLDDAAWQTADPITKLYQYEPRAGDRLTEDTQIRFLFNDRTFYIGVWCQDRDPDGIIARAMERDFFIPSDDYFYFFLGTFHDQRNGYVFAVNPNGARYDALVSQGTDVNSQWDGVWQVKTARDDQGWSAEVAIPLNSLSFDPNGDTWGFNISRNIRRKSERGRWTGARPELRTGHAAEAGDLLGLTDLKQGLGIEFSPFVTGRYHKSGGDTDWLGDMGADLRYRITPNLSGTLSYNTDFAETEVDDRQINLTRFPLFFPEKRGFFLEDSGIYNFGGLASSRRGRTGLRNLILPYFTRRIGLSDDGDIIPITVAGKLAGRIGDYELGITHAMLEGRRGLGTQQVTSGRILRHFGEQSSLGLLATVGDPNSEDGDSTLIGADYRFRTSDLFGDKVLESDVFALGTWGDDPDLGKTSDHAYGLSVAYPNEPLYLAFKYAEIGENFEPALGFVRRQGVRAYASTISLVTRPQDGWFREIRSTLSAEVFTDLDNSLDSGEFQFSFLEVEFHSADELEFEVEHNIDRPSEAFEIADGVFIPAGDYAWTEGSVSLTMARKRTVAMDVLLTAGEFYDGSRQRAGVEMDYLPNKYLSIGLDYFINRIDLPGGDFDTHLASARMAWKFTPDLTWSHLVQYDSISETMGFQSLLRWEYLPGSELFAVVNQAYAHEDRGFRTTDEEFAVKLGANFRF